MSDRRDYFFRQKVTEDELDQGFATLEQAILNVMLDLGKFGVVGGLVVTQHAGVPDLTTDITAGSGIDQQGRRLRIPSLQQLSVATDSNNTSTAVANGGNEKWVSIFLQFDRALSDPRTDGNSLPVYFVRNETFKLIVTQSAEAAVGLAVRPTLMSDAILLADVHRTFGQTQILNADISTTRRQDAIVIAGSPLAIRRGTPELAIADIVSAFNGLINGVGATLAAAFVTYAGGGSWAGGSSPTNPATNAEAQFDKMISDLSSMSSGASGAHRLGSDALVGGSGTIVAGTLYSVLLALKSLTNHEYGGSGAWADATSIAATNGETAIDTIVSTLAASTGSAKIGLAARTAWLNGRTNPATTLYAGVDKIITDLAATGSGDDGGERIGLASRSSWLDGTTNPATDVTSAFGKLITDLSSKLVSVAGSEKVGFFPTGNIAADTVGAAIRELDTEKGGLALANTWTSAGSQTFQGPITMSGTAGRFAWRTTAMADANTTIDVSSDEWKSPSTQAAVRLHTLRSTTSPIPVTGQHVKYVHPTTAATLYPTRLQREGGLLIAYVKPGGWARIDMVFNGFDWCLYSWSGDVVISNSAET